MNNPFLATYERDTASGLDYASARMYSNGRGRFMQADPIGLNSADLSRPQTLNRYSYVQNDPVNLVDPGGTDSVYWDCVTLYRFVANDMRWKVEACHPYELSARDPYASGGGGDQGGRGGGGQNRDNRTKEQKRKDGLDRARKAFERKECSDYIASAGYSDPLALMNELDKKGQFNESPEEAAYWRKRENWGHPAFTVGVGVDAKVKLRPDIDERNPTVFVTGFYNSTTYSLPLVPQDLNADTQRAIIFLHELAHATGRWNDTPGADHPGELIGNAELTKNIYEKCFK